MYITIQTIYQREEIDDLEVTCPNHLSVPLLMPNVTRWPWFGLDTNLNEFTNTIKQRFTPDKYLPAHHPS